MQPVSQRHRFEIVLAQSWSDVDAQKICGWYADC